MAQTLTDKNLVFRPPRSDDGPRVWSLVREAGTLDRNSAYCYLLLCTHFADTCVVAETGRELVGFVTAYRPPGSRGLLFVWQIGVAPSVRDQGVATRLLMELLNRDACRDVAFIGTTVTPSNGPSWALFHSLAWRLGAELSEGAGFGRELFPGGDHQPERLIRIGPIDEDRVRDAFSQLPKDAQAVGVS